MRSYKREISIYIAVPNLQEIDYNGSGNIVFQNTVYADRFYINMFNASGSIQAKLVANLVELKVHSGPGDIQASGSANDIVLFNGGNGQVDALQLSSKSGLAVNRSTGKIQVQVSDQLKAEIYESGSILYRGNPSINLKKEGSGMLSPI